MEATRLEGAAQALLTSESLDYPGEAFRDVKPASRYGMKGLQMDSVQEDDDGTFYNRHLVLGGSNVTYLLTAFTRNADLLDTVSRATFEGFSIDESLITTHTQAQLDARNRFGISRYENGDYEEALAHFQAAVSMSNTKRDFLRNVMDTLSRLDRHEEGVAYYEAHAGPHGQEDDLVSWYAWHLRHAGRIDDATAAFLRSRFQDYDLDGIRSWVEDLLGTYAHGSELHTFEVNQWEERSKPVEIQMTYLLRRYGQPHDEFLFAKIPAFWDRHYLAVERSMKRSTPFRISNTRSGCAAR